MRQLGEYASPSSPWSCNFLKKNTTLQIRIHFPTYTSVHESTLSDVIRLTCERGQIGLWGIGLCCSTRRVRSHFVFSVFSFATAHSFGARTRETEGPTLKAQTPTALTRSTNRKPTQIQRNLHPSPPQRAKLKTQKCSARCRIWLQVAIEKTSSNRKGIQHDRQLSRTPTFRNMYATHLNVPNLTKQNHDSPHMLKLTSRESKGKCKGPQRTVNNQRAQHHQPQNS